ncbi:hypothetical protein NP233_g5752 [Leucocoprinus birnbaumii]|uniref:Transcription factor CBF/NF-Y/archaeal histone domain-containing protein n=1 Tax=Leucocoprinus birnbaumii TaxID=56174 RepID=A0AAD5YRK8_9AGAR|nr:hypothetical protein NP233_g5752 [Leucocoprinus birnbaumii]
MSTSPEPIDMDEHIQELADDIEDQEQEVSEEEEESELEGEVEADREEVEDERGDTVDGEDRPSLIDDAQALVESATKEKKKKKKGTTDLVREPGKLFLPFSRVQKVIKQDKVRCSKSTWVASISQRIPQDIPIVARDAVFLIALATESFIMELASAAHRVATKEKRATVQHKDIETVVRKAEEFMFLEDILPYTISSAVPENRYKPKRSKPVDEASKGGKKHKGPTLDNFVLSREKEKEDEENNEMDIVINEDGTMHVVNE